MELEPARAEVSSRQLGVPDMVTVRGEVVVGSICLRLAATLVVNYQSGNCRVLRHRQNIKNGVGFASG
jgi:hypothetical protein